MLLPVFQGISRNKRDGLFPSKYSIESVRIAENTIIL